MADAVVGGGVGAALGVGAVGSQSQLLLRALPNGVWQSRFWNPAPHWALLVVAVNGIICTGVVPLHTLVSGSVGDTPGHAWAARRHFGRHQLLNVSDPFPVANALPAGGRLGGLQLFNLAVAAGHVDLFLCPDSGVSLQP